MKNISGIFRNFCLLILMIMANRIVNRESKFITNKVVNLNGHIYLKGSDFNFTSPMFIGSVSGGFMLICILIFFIILCKDESNDSSIESKGEEINKAMDIQNVILPQNVERASISIGIY